GRPIHELCAKSFGRPHIGRGCLQGIGLALCRAEGTAHHGRGGIGRQVAKPRAVDPLHVEPIFSLDRHLAAHSARLGVAPREQNSAMDGDFEIGAEFLLQPPPDPDGFDEQPDRWRKIAGPALAFDDKWFMRNLGMEAAGVGPGRLGVEIVALDHKDLGSFACQIIGSGRAGETSAHDQDIAMHRGHWRKSVIAPCRVSILSVYARTRRPAGAQPCTRHHARARSRPMPKQFRGSYTVTITPFSEDGRKTVIPAWRRFLDWQIKVGVPGVIILGTTGEFLTITDDERRQFVESTVRHVKGRMDVLVGTMNAYTPNAVRYSREAEE